MKKIIRTNFLLTRQLSLTGISTIRTVKPTTNEASPSPPIKVTRTRHIRRTVQSRFETIYERTKSDSLEDGALELKAAIVHWLRHTGISKEVKFRRPEYHRDDAIHASMAKTDRYIDSGLRERHASGEEKTC